MKMLIVVFLGLKSLVFASETTCTQIGLPCAGGIYAGEFEGAQLITTPGNCTNSKTPDCDGGTDTLQFKWAAQTGVVTKATNKVDGRINTALILKSKHSQKEAVEYCENLDFGGYTDWYLPAQDELFHLYQHKDLIQGFNTTGLLYWSSTEINMGMVKMIKFRDGAQLNGGKPSLYLVRCVRRA